MIRRLLQDHDEFRGEVIFTFDGDEAGQKAALRAFEGDQVFAGQTYVAVEPSGLDPCDLRLQQGDAEVRELVARRVPLYRFVLANVVQRYDLDRADGRIDAMREAAKLVTSIRDRSKVDAFARELAGMLGIEPMDVQREVRRAAARGGADAAAGARAQRRPRSCPTRATPASPSSARRSSSSSSTPRSCPRGQDVDGDDFTHGAYRALVVRHRRPGADRRRRAAGRPRCVTRRPTRGSSPDQRARRRAAALRKEPDDAYVSARAPAARAHRHAAHRRPQVPAAAHQPGRAGDRLQPDVR